MGKWFKAMAVGLVIAISAQFMMGFASDCGEIREQAGSSATYSRQFGF